MYILFKVNTVLIALIFLGTACEKFTKPTNLDYAPVYFGEYNANSSDGGYSSFSITSGENENQIIISGFSKFINIPITAVTTSATIFKLSPWVKAELPLYGGVGCGGCLLQEPRIRRMTGFGEKIENEITITTSHSVKYTEDDEFSYLQTITHHLTKIE